MKKKANPTTTFTYRWIMLALIWFVYFSSFLIFFSTPSIITLIASDLSLNYSQMGTILGVFLLAYIPLAVPSGILIDRFGTKKTIFIGLLLISISGFLQSLSTGFWDLLVFASIFGIGMPFISIGAPKVVASWFSGKQRGFASGVYLTGGFIGAATSLAITNALIIPIFNSWRIVSIVYGGFGLLIGFLWLWLKKISPYTQKGIKKTGILWNKIILLLKEKQIWIVAIIAFSSVFFAGNAFGRWLPGLLEFKGFSTVESGFLASIPGWFGLISSIIIPSIRGVGSRKIIVFVVLFVQGSCIFFSGFVNGLPLILVLVFYGISSATIMPLLVVILMDMKQVGAKNMGAAGGVLFSLQGLGGFFGPLVVGSLIDYTGSIIPSIILLTILVESMLFFVIIIKEKNHEN